MFSLWIISGYLTHFGALALMPHVLVLSLQARPVFGKNLVLCSQPIHWISFSPGACPRPPTTRREAVMASWCSTIRYRSRRPLLWEQPR